MTDRQEYDRRTKAFYRLCDDARMLPDTRRTPEQVVERLRRFGKRTRLATVERIIREYDERPHICAVFTDHSFGSACSLGKRHAGCCPGCPTEKEKAE